MKFNINKIFILIFFYIYFIFLLRFSKDLAKMAIFFFLKQIYYLTFFINLIYYLLHLNYYILKQNCLYNKIFDI